MVGNDNLLPSYYPRLQPLTVSLLAQGYNLLHSVCPRLQPITLFLPQVTTSFLLLAPGYNLFPSACPRLQPLSFCLPWVTTSFLLLAPQVDGKKLAKAVLWVLFNQTVVGIPCIYLSYLAMEWRGCDFGPELSTFHWLLFEIAICTLVEEVGFYYGHRSVAHIMVHLQYSHTKERDKLFTGSVCHYIEHGLGNHNCQIIRMYAVLYL